MFFFFSFLFFVGRSILCKFISHNCSKQSLRWEQRAEGSWRAYNHTLQPGFPPQAWGGGNNNKKKKKRKHSCGVHNLHWFWLVLTPLPHTQPTNTLCASVWSVVVGFFIYLFLPSQQRATVVSAFFFPQQRCTFWQKVGTFKKTWAFLIITDLFLHVVFVFCFFWSPYKYNRRLFPCIQSPQKQQNRHRYLQIWIDNS